MKQPHIMYMEHALFLAEKGKGRTSPNPLVGAVIINDGDFVGKGYHQKAGEPHAEIHALREAGEKAKGGTLYVNLEPCCHWGRTPPCTEAIIKAGIAQVYVAMVDPNPKVDGKGIEQLKKAGITVNVGLFAASAERLNEIYIKHCISGYPFVILKMGISLDGKIATSIGDSQWITSPSSRLVGHRIRDQVDAILVGIGTILSDDPELTTRLPNFQGKDATRIVLDSHGRTPTNAKIFNSDSDASVIIAVTPKAEPKNLELLENKGAEVLIIPENEGQVCIKTLMKTLGSRGITSVLIEGGGKVYSSALKSGILNKVMCFIAPKIIGGKESPSIFDGFGFEKLSDALLIERLEVHQLDVDIFIEGYFKDNVYRYN